jgi:hypothetical protein
MTNEAPVAQEHTMRGHLRHCTHNAKSFVTTRTTRNSYVNKDNAKDNVDAADGSSVG